MPLIRAKLAFVVYSVPKLYFNIIKIDFGPSLGCLFG